MSRESNLIKNTAILGIGTFFPKLVNIVTLPILTGYLTKKEFGSYDLIITLVSLFLPIVTLQIQSAAFRFLIERRDNRDQVDSIITNILVFTLPISVISLAVLYFFIPGISAIGRFLICVYYFFDISYVTFQQIARGLSYNLIYSISSIVISTANLILIVLLVWKFKNGLYGVLIAMAVAYALGLFYLAYKIKDKWSFRMETVSKKYIGEMLNYSWPMVPNNLSGWVLRLSDRLILTAFLGIEANAMYAVANKIPNIYSAVHVTLNNAWVENASIASKDDDKSAYYSSMCDNYFRILVALMAGLMMCSPLLFRFLIKGDYDEAYYQMPVLYFGMLFLSMSSVVGGIYIAFKKTQSVGITTILAAVLNLVIDLILVKKIGIWAASLSTMISYAVLFVYRMIGVQRFQKVKFNVPVLVLGVAFLTLMSVLNYQKNLICDLINVAVFCLTVFILDRKMIKSIYTAIMKKFKKLTNKFSSGDQNDR